MKRSALNLEPSKSGIKEGQMNYTKRGVSGGSQGEDKPIADIVKLNAEFHKHMGTEPHISDIEEFIYKAKGVTPPSPEAIAEAYKKYGVKVNTTPRVFASEPAPGSPEY
jgi:hypothetical protein